MKDLITIKELAEQLGISKTSVVKKLKQANIEAVSIDEAKGTKYYDTTKLPQTLLPKTPQKTETFSEMVTENTANNEKLVDAILKQLEEKDAQLRQNAVIIANLNNIIANLTENNTRLTQQLSQPKGLKALFSHKEK